MSRDSISTMEDQDVDAGAATTTTTVPQQPPLSATAAAAAATTTTNRREGLLRNCHHGDRSFRNVATSSSDHSSTTRWMTPTSSRSLGACDGGGPLGDSILSLDLDCTEDAVLPPPELTRPEPRHSTPRSDSNNSGGGAGAAAGGGAGAAAGGGGRGTGRITPWVGTRNAPETSGSGRPRPSLESIMQEQKQQQQEEEALRGLRRRGVPADDDDKSLCLEEVNRVISSQDGDDAAVEEALLKLALERSLRSLHAEKRGGGGGSCGGGGGESGGGTSSYHNSMRSLSSEFAREMQMEADRTEQDLDTVLDTPHRRTPSRGRSSDEAMGENASGFSIPRRAASRSNSGHRTPQQLNRRSTTGVASASPSGHGSRSPSASAAAIPGTSSLSTIISLGTPASGGGHHSRSGLAPRRGVRRAVSLDLQTNSTPSAPQLGSAPSSRSAHRTGSGSSAGGASLSSASGSGAPARICVRQASIRIGPLPKNALVEDGTLVDGAEAVLEVARKNLSANEVVLIERALRKGKPLSVVGTADGSGGSGVIAKRSGRRLHSQHRGNPHSASTATMGDSRHSTSDGSTSITSDELDGGTSHHLHRRHHPIEMKSDHLSYRSPVQRGSGRSRSPASPAKDSPAASSFASAAPSVVRDEYDLRGAEENLSEEELRQIQRALLETDDGTCVPGPAHGGGDPEATASSGEAPRISPTEVAAIEQAIREAKEEEEMRSFCLALQMQQEEDERLQSQRVRHQQGNVRIMTRAEFEAESRQRVGAFQAAGRPIEHHPLDHHQQPDASPGGYVAAGFRMNCNVGRHEWTRRDQNSVVGPNQEVRTKHDASLDGQANAYRLGLDDGDEMGGMTAAPRVGNTAYNSFMQSIQRRNRKGVAAHGTGRAGGSDADATKGGAMDANVRLLISRAINSGLIERCNGVVKEGKEAILYHADQSHESDGFDVAIKIFKRIQDFKGRGDYVDGDPRYFHENFRRLSGREQLELWTEKEFRNLTRASRAGVPVPSPLFHRENVLFMRFLGTEGWPAPQLREIDIRHGSKKWGVLYSQVIDAVRKLYRAGRLVHGDLSEYNILVVPAFMVENGSPGAVANAHQQPPDLQAVLIDFGQAVDTRHPDAVILLQHDLDRVKSFFAKQGVETMGSVEALAYVVDEE